MSRGGEDPRRQKRRWFLRCRQGTELGLRRRENPFILPKLSPDCGRRLTEVKKMHCGDSAPADFAGVNLPLPWTWVRKPIPLPLNFPPLRGNEVGICAFKRLTSHEIFFAKKIRIEYLPKEAGKEGFALRQEINKMLFHERTMKTRSALPALRVCP